MEPHTSAAPGTTTAAPAAALGPEQLHTLWRAANYVSVGQIYLLANPLLAEPLAASTSSPGCWAIGAPPPAST